MLTDRQLTRARLCAQARGLLSIRAELLSPAPVLRPGPGAAFHQSRAPLSSPGSAPRPGGCCPSEPSSSLQAALLEAGQEPAPRKGHGPPGTWTPREQTPLTGWVRETQRGQRVSRLSHVLFRYAVQPPHSCLSLSTKQE